MKLVLVFTLCLAYASPSRILNNEEVQNEDDPNATIINGNDAGQYQFPYMVSLQLNNNHRCGGAILSESWVVSAHHCFWPSNSTTWKNLTAVAGLIVLGDNNKDIQKSPIAKIVPHPKYEDIALLKLELPFFFTKAVQPVGLPKPNSESSGRAWLSGWGVNFLSSVAEETTPILQALLMVIRSNEQCKSIWSTYFPNRPLKMSETRLCALPLKKRQSGCFGDSGGPLVKDGVLVGTVEGGDGNCGGLWNARLPNLFTKVSRFIDFIHENVKDLPKAKLL